LSITNRVAILKKKGSFWVSVACAIAISLVLESYVPFSFYTASRTTQVTSGGNQTENYTSFYYSYTAFGSSTTYNLLLVLVTLFRDLFLVVALIALNVLILIEIMKMRKRRINMTNKNPGAISNTSVMNQSVSKSLQAEKRKALMIVFTGINYFLCHSVYLVFTITRDVYQNFYSPSETGFLCFQFTAYFLLSLSYATPFFFYYFFNKQFNKFAKRALTVVFYPLVMLKRMVGLAKQEDETMGSTVVNTNNRTRTN
jgi:hypothetical protein